MERTSTRSYLIVYLKIIVGAVIYAASFRFFIYPNDVVLGGVVGIATILNYLTELPVGVMTIVFNIPLFIFSWKHLGLKFLISSLIAMLVSSTLMDLMEGISFVATTDPLLAATFGGAIKGLGLGLIYSTTATVGGTDIIAKFLRRKYQHINFSTFILAMDVAIFLLFALLFGKLDSAMYSAICMFITSQVVDIILYGAVNSKVCYVITDRSNEIKEVITSTLRRGVTYIHGEGAWSGQKKNIILCVIKRNQIVELKKLVREIDDKAFMIVSDSREVFGKGFTYIGDEN